MDRAVMVQLSLQPGVSLGSVKKYHRNVGRMAGVPYKIHNHKSRQLPQDQPAGF
jgi:hypothetical protein